jgi:hypothetical protein
MPEIPPVPPPADRPVPPPPPPADKPPADRAALIAAYPAQVPGTADKKAGSGQSPAASNADQAKGTLAQTASDIWSKASGFMADTAKELSAGVAKAEQSVKPGGAVFEAADRIVNPSSNEHPVEAAVMNNLAKRGEAIVNGVQGALKAEGDHLGNLVYYGTHLNEAGAPAKLRTEVENEAKAPLQQAENVVKGTAQLVKNVGNAAGDLAYYGVMHTDERGAAVKAANAVTDLAMDGPQLALAVDGAAGLGKGLAGAALSEAETAAAVNRAYKVGAPPVEAPPVEAPAVKPPPVDPPPVAKPGEVPPEIAGGRAANDNAIPPSQPHEQVLAPTGTDGVPAGGQPKLGVIEGGAADPDAARAMAGDAKGTRPPADRPQPLPGAGADPAAGTGQPGRGRVEGPGDVKAGPKDELGQLIKDQKADADAQFRGESGLDHSDTEPLPDETIPDEGERGRMPQLDPRESSRPDPERMQQGIDFDRAQRGAYTADQLTLANGKILDSYTKDVAIVSRKHTQLAEISPAQAENYVHEILDKYPPGTVIADTPANRAAYPGLKPGERLSGQMVLEVPVQQAPIPQEFGDWAARLGVTIRDFNGQVLNGGNPPIQR